MTTRRALLAAGCVALLTAACDMDPGFVMSDGDPFLALPHLYYQVSSTVHDNPTVMGTSLVWSENWRYHDANPLDPTRPASTRQTVWADSGAPLNTSQSVTEFTADTPIFAGSMSLSSVPWTLPSGGVSSVYTTTLSSRTVPWLRLPAECERINSPSCQRYMSRPSPNETKPYTFPFVVGDINLPAGVPVMINRVTRMHDPSTGGIWGTKTFLRESARLRTDPDLIVVPVHVHVFTDTSGATNNSFMGGLTAEARLPDWLRCCLPEHLFGPDDSGRLTMAYAIRKVFDDYAVNVISMATQASTTSWHREYTTEMTRNPIDETTAYGSWNVFDEMIDTCKVQVTLGSVDFIEQSSGLETAEIGFGHSISDILPWWDAAADPKMAADSALMREYIVAMRDVPGAHVFVVGNANPGAFKSPDNFGLTPYSEQTPQTGYTLIKGSYQPGASWTSVLQHEVGHVLGLSSPEDPSEAEGWITAMFNHALTPAMCDKMRSRSRNLLQ
jgi:hypothetical protein